MKREACRSCGGKLSISLIDLGSQPPSNALLDAGQDEFFYPLHAVVCEACYLVQLNFDVPPHQMFGDYPYFSSYSKDWLAHSKRYAEMAIDRFALGSKSLVIEIGSNDGYLLKYFKGVNVLGIEPSHTVAQAAIHEGIRTQIEYFGSKMAQELPKADLVVANNVLAHVPDLNDFLAGVAACLKPNGVATFEFPHLLNLIQGCEFDTIYHEHYSYFSLHALEPALLRHGLYAYDAEELPTHGGSLRVYVSPRKNVSLARLMAVRAKEEPLRHESTYLWFTERAQKCRATLHNFFARAKCEGKTVLGYGAAAKGNTLLNYCGITTKDMPAVGDITPAKQGKLLPGTHIPVVSEADFIARKPDYVLILPWNWQAEIRERLKALPAQFVTAIPLIRFYEARYDRYGT